MYSRIEKPFKYDRERDGFHPAMMDLSNFGGEDVSQDRRLLFAHASASSFVAFTWGGATRALAAAYCTAPWPHFLAERPPQPVLGENGKLSRGETRQWWRALRKATRDEGAVIYPALLCA